MGRVVKKRVSCERVIDKYLVGCDRPVPTPLLGLVADVIGNITRRGTPSATCPIAQRLRTASRSLVRSLVRRVGIGFCVGHVGRVLRLHLSLVFLLLACQHKRICPPVSGRWPPGRSPTSVAPARLPPPSSGGFAEPHSGSIPDLDVSIVGSGVHPCPRRGQEQCSSGAAACCLSREQVSVRRRSLDNERRASWIRRLEG